jgi:hypothetical protein
MDHLVAAVGILWFVIGMASAILRNEHGYWRALMFGAMGPFAIRRKVSSVRREAENDWDHWLVAERRSPPPWSVEELDACFVVKDSAGQKLAYVNFEEEPGRRSAARTNFTHRFSSETFGRQTDLHVTF